MMEKKENQGPGLVNDRKGYISDIDENIILFWLKSTAYKTEEDIAFVIMERLKG